MKTRFEWQTEGQGEFGDTTPEEEGRYSRSRLGCLAAMLALSAVIVILLAWQLSRNQSQAIADVSEDVLLAFELQQQAAENGDEELFSLLLSSSDLDWKRDQERLLAEGLFNSRGNLGLAGILRTSSQPTVELSPDLQRAELVYVQAYETVAGAPETQDVNLLHTIFYRLEDGRWKQTDADRSFWGPRDVVEGVFTAITFPEHDAQLARELSTKLEIQIERFCSEVGIENEYGDAFCTGTEPWRINLNPDVESLLNFSDTPVAKSSAFDFELPAPSIVGVPRDDRDHGVYVDLYARSLLRHMEHALLSTAPYPDQNIYALCFDHPLNGRHLYRYDWHGRSWQPVLAAQAFEHLSSLPDDSAIMMTGDAAITVMGSNRESPSADHSAVWQGSLPEGVSQSLIGWIDVGEASFHLVQHGAAGEPPGYSALDLRKCDALGCSLRALPGFPIPAAMGDAVLILIGSQIVLQSDVSEKDINLGAGFSPFWLDDETFGFVRFAGDIDSGINTEVVLGSLSGNGLQQLFDGSDLAREAGILWGNVLFVKDVVPNPADPDLLLVSSTGIHEYSGQYYLFSVDIADRSVDPEITLEVARSGSQGGVPGLLTPTGPLPFLVSSDGRWLAMTELQSQDRETWTVLVHDLETGTTSEVSDSVPAMPGNYPLLDWSGDGQWLLVADREFLHLIAPAYNRQELIAHDFDACSHIVWAD